MSDLSTLVLTNYPVIENASYITITVNNSATYDGVLIGADPQRGLALLKICCKDSLHALSFGDSSTTLAGTEVIAIGYALSIEGAPTVTQGSVSALRYHTELDRYVIQTNAPINPGNSGGPLLSSNGEVLGINTSGIRGTGSGITIEGFGFAISERTLTSALPSLKAGSITTPQPGAAGGPYLNEKHWYSTNIPTDWRIDSSDSDAVAMWDPLSDATVWISVNEIDPDLYPTLDTYLAQWEPTPAEDWTNFQITSRRRIITNLPTDIQEFIYTFEFQGKTYLGKAHWYLLGKHTVKVTAIATSTIWTFQLHSQIRNALETARQSFQPFSYTSNVYGYSLAHPLTWKPLEGPGYDYQASDPLDGSTLVYVRVDSVSGYPSIDIYGASQSVSNAEVLSRQVLFPKRPNPSYKMDYSYTSQTTGKQFRGAVLIALSGENAIWIYVQDYSENWSQISSLVDDIFLRLVFKP